MIEIKILDNGLATIREEKGMSIAEKQVSVEDLGRAFHSMAAYESPFLPGESGLMKYIVNGDIEKYVYVTPPQNVTVEQDYYDEDEDETCSRVVDCPAPHLIWFLKFIKQGNGGRRLTESRVYSLKNQLLSLDDQLYVCPFANVFDNGKICWGYAEPEFGSERSIQSVITKFFGAPFNEDLEWTRFNSNDLGVRNPSQFVGACSDYYEKGKPCETIDKLFDSLKTADYTINRVLANL